MAINITKVLDEIQTRLDDSTQTDRSLTALIAASNRIDNSGTGVLTYRSYGHLPETTDSAYYGTIAYVEVDNVFGDSSGRFYYGSSRDSGWIQFTTLQDSDEATIPSAAPGPASPAYAGDNYGFSLAGGSSPYTQNIDAYSYASDGDATNVGAFNNPNPTAMWTGMGGGTTTEGYHFGGSPLTPGVTHVYKFGYAAGTPVTASDAGFDMAPSSTSYWRYGHTEMLGNRTAMYVAGGRIGPSGNSTNNIFKFPEADASAIVDVGNLTVARRLQASASSDESGYMVGGYVSAAVNTIDKWSFSTTGNATDVGDLATAARNNMGHSSSTHGYSAGNSPVSNQIQKFSFASDGNATDAADLHTGTDLGGASSSATHGYIHGGQPSIVNIQKYPFAADENGTDVGDLPFHRRASAGTHY